MKPDTLKALITHLKANQYIKEHIRKDMLHHDLSLSEFMVLELLYHQKEQPIQMIAKKVLLTSGSMTYVINQMEHKQLILKRRCDKDQRITYIDLTPSGRQLIERIFPQHEQMIQSMFSILTEEELKQWIDLHKKIGYDLEAKSKEGKK